MKKVVEYFVGVKDEMSKVTWPTKDEVVQATILVVVFSLVLSLIVMAFDMPLEALVKTIMESGN